MAEILKKAKIDRTKLAVVLVTVLILILIVILILSRNLDSIRAFLLSSGQIGLVISVGLTGSWAFPRSPWNR